MQNAIVRNILGNNSGWTRPLLHYAPLEISYSYVVTGITLEAGDNNALSSQRLVKQRRRDVRTTMIRMT